MGVVETALNAGLTYSTYKDDREKGKGGVFSAIHAVGTTIIMNEFMLPAIALSLAPMLPIMHQAIANKVGMRQKQMMPMSPFNSQPDSQQAATSRQRALGAIANSQISARNVLGNEAGIYAPRFR
jgi:hypothetical protein